LAFTVGAKGQSSTWDGILSNSQWYVPGDNLRSYIASGTNLADNAAVADQTLWTLGVATNGVFTGTSSTDLKEGAIVISSTRTMSGLVTTEGQIRIVFTGTSGTTTIGIGQMREITGTTYMEMQMLTSIGGSYLTHWAYMTPYDGNPETLPALDLPTTPISQEWAWMEDTTWNLASDGLFGPGGVGTFTLGTYDNGYYWGTGTGPEGSATESFSVIGSATPEGNILFDVLSDGVLTSLAGQIAGDATTGEMALRIYDAAGNPGDASVATVVPEPGTVALLMGALGSFLILRWRLMRKYHNAKARIRTAEFGF